MNWKTLKTEKMRKDAGNIFSHKMLKIQS